MLHRKLLHCPASQISPCRRPITYKAYNRCRRGSAREKQIRYPNRKCWRAFSSYSEEILEESHHNPTLSACPSKPTAGWDAVSFIKLLIFLAGDLFFCGTFLKKIKQWHDFYFPSFEQKHKYILARRREAWETVGGCNEGEFGEVLTLKILDQWTKVVNNKTYYNSPPPPLLNGMLFINEPTAVFKRVNTFKIT